MRLLEVVTLAGPNVDLHGAVLRGVIELEELTGRESSDVPGFVDRLLATLPGLHDHHCGAGRPGGFAQRLHEGTFFGHVVEHAAIEMSQLAGVPVDFGRTRAIDAARGLYRIVVAYRCEHTMRQLLRDAVELVDALVADRPYDIDERLVLARRLAERHAYGPSTRAIVDAATARGIPVRPIAGDGLVQLGWGRRRRIIAATLTDGASGVGLDIAADKAVTKSVLAAAAIRVPAGASTDRAADIDRALAAASPPWVVKPLDGHQGEQVMIDLMTPDDAARAVAAVLAAGRQAIVEEQLHGRDYRVLVVGGRVVAASEREPASVTGDGMRSVRALVALANEDPRRGEGHTRALTRLALDAAAFRELAAQGLLPDDVPAAGRVVRLASAANLSAGGTATDVTARVHPEVAAICERAARLVGLDVCGVDLVMPDIGAPDWRAGGIVEVNAAPGIRMHEHPAAGEPRRVGRAIVDALFPSGDGRIPVVAVTGTNGKTSVTRLVGHVLASCGRCVGMTTTDEMIVDGRVVARGDLTGPASAWGILADPLVDVAVLETARGGIMRGGLGWDWADVGVLTNVQLDHIGQDGLRTIDDVMHVKSLVAERVREGGTLVLNADDERVARVPDRPGMRGVRRRVVWFSANPESARVRRHCALGGTAVVARDGWIVERSGGEEHALIALASLPVLQGGVSAFQVPNLLAAVAAVRALGLGRDRVVDALGRVPAAALAGRGSLYALHGGYVLLDYGHNAAAFEAVGRSLAAFPDHRRTALIGLPGDRADWVIEQAGRVAARVFDRLIVRDDADRRGRAEGEVATLLCRAVATATPARPCRLVHDAAEALNAALAEARPGEIVVVFWDEDRGAIDERLRREGATPAAGIAARPRPANRLGA